MDTENALVNLNQIKFAYSGGSSGDSSGNSKTLVLDLPIWRVVAGESVLLIGDSGSGKSTLLNILSGILVPDSGTAMINGQALNVMSNRQRDQFRARQIGYVAQDFNLIPYLSGIDNIKLANHFANNSNQTYDDSEIKANLLELNISEAQWHRPVRQLSIGQQQRIAIARAIINKPTLLIADEPTSSLDHVNRDNFMSILTATAHAHQMTLIFVTHDLSLSRYFDRVDSMNDINKLER